MIVTGGGGSGCGRAIAATFAERGAVVLVSNINEAAGQETVRLIEQRGSRSAFFCADVGNEPQVRKLVNSPESRFGSLSVLANNASSPHPAGEGLAGWAGALLGTICATRWARSLRFLVLLRKSLVHRPNCQLQPVPNLGLGENIGKMMFHRILAQGKPCGNFFIYAAGDNQRNDFALSRCEF